MKLDGQFLSSPTGQLLAVAVLIGVAGIAVLWPKRNAAALPAPQAAATATLPEVFARNVPRFEPPAPSTPVPPEPVPAQIPTPRPTVLPLQLIAWTPQAPAVRRAPVGRLIPCETVITLESNQQDTPLVGLVTEDVWENGERLIPAGAEVHGQASFDPGRQRLRAQGAWTILWRSPVPVELQVQGVALEHGTAEAGSAGLRGTLQQPEDGREARLFAASFLGAATAALQETRTTTGLLGETNLPAATGRNAALAGTSAVLRDYARQIQSGLTPDAVSIRVPAGTAFFLYVTQPLAVPAG